MKLAVINFSGNVGKSTVARHLLAARIPGCQLIAVESINAQDSPSITIRGRQFAQLQDALLTVPDLVVDVGASNVEELLGVMRRYHGSHTDFDAFIVPTVPDRKQQQDTAATLAELARIGVPPERLRLVFNRLEDDEPVERVFETLLAYCAASGVVQPRLAACLPYNEVYARVRGTDCSLIELAADPTDYKAAIVSADSTAEQMALVQKLATQRLAQGVVPELDACFAALELVELGQQAPSDQVDLFASRRPRSDAASAATRRRA
ncbi:StbB family protein [Paucibacter sp. M5-1]|uniref:StbB family protein n=1 Tax=Paucibacter sp. M5-1 TaxID=3015998 RepID=UPI0022B89A9A|nr:StbB family protein [Paucibacter sp. M5-1]MCZ7881565.1 StbB family protein [Paucibacter sp. M5-1]